MKQDISWNKLAVEAFVIVGSILLAFAIDAGWQIRNDRIEEQAALQSLLSEFTANLEVIEASIEAHARHLKSTELLLGMSLGQIPVAEDIQRIAGDTFLRYRSTNYAGGTLTAILSSGEISIIRNPELRRKIAAWPSILEDATEDEQIVVRYRTQVLLPFVANHLHSLIVDGFISTELNTGEGLSQIHALLGNGELEGVVSTSGILRRSAANQLVSAKDYLQELIELISAEDKG